MNLKKQFNVVVDKRQFGGERKLVSINKLHLYIPEDRAQLIIDKIKVMKAQKKRFKAQNIAVIDVYTK